MILVLHATGNTFVRALLSGLDDAGVDFRFFTTIAATSSGMMGMLPGPWRRQLIRRQFDIPASRLVTRSRREWVRLAASQAGMFWLTKHEVGWACVDAVYRDLDRSIARRLAKCDAMHPSGTWIYGYEDGCLESFRVARQLGMNRAYELPIAFWKVSRRLLEEESRRLPEWAGTLVGTDDSVEKLERKSQELALADVVIVPSQFVARSLEGELGADQRVVVAEFGSPGGGKAEIGKWKAESGKLKAESGKLKTGKSQPLRVLFAGSMSQRKGLADVFETIRLLGRSDVELVVMGSPVAPMAFYHAQGVPFTYEAPRPHQEVLELMETCDVLVLPSIVEGRALVQQEALSCGLPLLVTPNAGGEDLVVEGETGFLVPIRSPEALADKIAWFADHRAHLEAMREACREQAARCTWQRYTAGIFEALQLSQASVC